MEVVKTIDPVSQDLIVRNKNKDLMRKLSQVGYSTEKSDRFKLSTVLHRFMSRFIESRTYNHDYKRDIKYASNETEMHNGTVIKGDEYEQFYTKVNCHLKQFTFLGLEFKIKYSVLCESFRQPRINQRLKPIYHPGMGIPYGGGLKYYHIGNKQVTKEEYEAYKSNK